MDGTTAGIRQRGYNKGKLVDRRFAIKTEKIFVKKKLTNVLPSFAVAFSGPAAGPPILFDGGVLLLMALPPSSLAAPYLPALVLVDPRLCRRGEGDKREGMQVQTWSNLLVKYKIRTAQLA